MRRKDRAVTDEAAIRDILERAKVLHLALNAEGAPYVVPLHYGYRLEGGALTLYVHCAKEGRKLELLRRDPRVFVEIDLPGPLIPGAAACSWGAAFESVMCRARGSVVEDAAEKAAALALLMKTQTGRDFAIDEKAAAAVTVVRLDAEEISAKARRLPG